MRKIISRLLHVIYQTIVGILILFIVFTVQIPLWILTGFDLLDKLHKSTCSGYLYILQLKISRWGGNFEKEE